MNKHILNKVALTLNINKVWIDLNKLTYLKSVTAMFTVKSVERQTWHIEKLYIMYIFHICQISGDKWKKLIQYIIQS